MGLDVLACRKIKLIENLTQEDCLNQSGEIQYFDPNLDFTEHSANIIAGFYSNEGMFNFRAGNYSGYNHWRALLCEKFAGIKDKDLWKNHNEYKYVNFYYLINFSDCDGIIDTEHCEILLNDFLVNYNRLINRDVDFSSEKEESNFISLYKDFMTAFAIGSNGGCVQFT